MTSTLPRINYDEWQKQLSQRDPWSAAFERIQEDQRLTADGIRYCVSWKHTDSDWVELTFRAGKKQQTRIVRKGDPLLLELRHE